MTWVPSEANTSSKARVNLLSRSRIRNRGVAVPAGRSIESSRARWTTQSPFGWRVTPARRTCRVPSSMKNSTYSVVRHTVSTVKKSVATMPEACARRNARHVTDGGRRHRHSQLLEFALDAPVTPARVLPGQPHDQRNHVLGERWTATSRVGPRPLAGDQAPVPPQDRAWRHEVDRPVGTGKRPAQDRKNRTIGRAELDSLHLAAQHTELVAQDRDLDVLGVLAA